MVYHNRQKTLVTDPHLMNPLKSDQLLHSPKLCFYCPNPSPPKPLSYGHYVCRQHWSRCNREINKSRNACWISSRYSALIVITNGKIFRNCGNCSAFDGLFGLFVCSWQTGRVSFFLCVWFGLFLFACCFLRLKFWHCGIPEQDLCLNLTPPHARHKD